MTAGPALLRALVFDMDGTLFDSTAAVTEAYREAVLRGGGRPCAPEEVVAAYPLGPPAAILTHLLGRPCEAADLRTYHVLLERLTDRLMVYPGVPETLHALAAKGVPLAVFTGASHQAARIVLAGAGLLRHFSVVVGGDEIARPKPEPDGVEFACLAMGVECPSSGYVGDSPLDLEAARRSGARAIAAAWGHLFNSEAAADTVRTEPWGLLAMVETAC
jgi:HAD superfamily hydrolase (TIGR01509 family)